MPRTVTGVSVGARRGDETATSILFDDVDALAGFLEVDAIKPVADKVRGADAHVEHFRGDLVDGKGFVAALVRRAVGAVVDDLPVLLGHRILADEQRLAGQYPDPPIKFRRHEALRQQQVGLLEELRYNRLEGLHVVRLAHSAAE